MDEAVVNVLRGGRCWCARPAAQTVDVGRLAAKVAGVVAALGRVSRHPPVGRIREFIAGALKLDLDDRAARPES